MLVFMQGFVRLGILIKGIVSRCVLLELLRPNLLGKRLVDCSLLTGIF